MFRAARGGAAATVLAAVLSSPSPATAAPPEGAPPSDVVAELIARGKSEYAAGHQQQAYDALRAAWAVYKSPKLACVLGQVELELEKYRDAADHLTTCSARYPLPEQGQKDLKRAKSHVATLDLTAPTEATIQVDGVSVGTAPVGTLFLEPGDHELLVQLDGYESRTERFTVVAGDSLVKRIDFKPKASEPSPAPVSTPATPSADSPKESGSSMKTVALIGGGVATVGFVIAGAVFRVNAYSAKDERERLKGQVDDCSNSMSTGCSDILLAHNDYVDSGNMSNLMFGIGAGFAVLTVGAYFLWPDSKPTKAQRQPWVGVAIGPRGLSARGTF
ncbi:MAG: PEGA domain-containing protein [Polyangiaceae bacterium]